MTKMMQTRSTGTSTRSGTSYKAPEAQPAKPRSTRKRATSSVDAQAQPSKKKKTDEKTTAGGEGQVQKGRKKAPRMTSDKRAQLDAAAETPQKLTRTEQLLEASGTPIAPPERARPPRASILPPRPNIPPNGRQRCPESPCKVPGTSGRRGEALADDDENADEDESSKGDDQDEGRAHDLQDHQEDQDEAGSHTHGSQEDNEAEGDENNDNNNNEGNDAPQEAQDDDDDAEDSPKVPQSTEEDNEAQEGADDTEEGEEQADDAQEGEEHVGDANIHAGDENGDENAQAGDDDAQEGEEHGDDENGNENAQEGEERADNAQEGDDDTQHDDERADKDEEGEGGVGGKETRDEHPNRPNHPQKTSREPKNQGRRVDNKAKAVDASRKRTTSTTTTKPLAHTAPAQAKQATTTHNVRTQPGTTQANARAGVAETGNKRTAPTKTNNEQGGTTKVNPPSMKAKTTSIVKAKVGEDKGSKDPSDVKMISPQASPIPPSPPRDIPMQSPPSSPTQNLQGASRITGGFIRGRAVGNVFNFADGLDLPTNLLEPFRKGKVLLYTTGRDVDLIKPKLSLKHDVSPTLGPILLTLKKRYTRIYNPRATVCVYEDDMWDLRGEYDQAVENDEDVAWEFKNDGYVLRILVENDNESALPVTSTPILVTAPHTSRLATGSPPPYSNAASTSLGSSGANLMTLLGISPHLTNRADRNIHFAYQKYKAYIQASQTVAKRISEGTWPGKRPSTTDLIEIFLSKSMWFSHYKPVFSKVSNYPLMVEWLENEEGKPSDLEVWGVEKPSYSLTDLKKYVDNGTLAEEPVVQKGKGKKKAKDECLAGEFKKGTKVVDKGSPKKKAGPSKKKVVNMRIAMAFILKVFLALVSTIINAPFIVGLLLVFASLPLVFGLGDQDPFPDIPFSVFSTFIQQNLGPEVSLSTVLLLVFSVLENPECFSLHARQQCPRYPGEKASGISGWIKHLTRAIQDKLGSAAVGLLRKQDIGRDMSEDQIISATSSKLIALAKVLQFYPQDKDGNFLGKLGSVSQKLIQPVQVICPTSVHCMTATCKPRSLLQATRTRDIPKVTLIKNSIIYDKVPVLTGKCPDCLTFYHADHERVPVATEEDVWNRVYLNSAKYFKVGQSIWVDRLFSSAALNGMYSFHASTAAYMEFWNNTFWETQDVQSRKLSRRHIWQAFIQESIRTIGSMSDVDLEIRDGLAIDEVAKEAFEILGENGIIRAADQHACSECTHQYKKTADWLTGDDPAALVNNDENRVVPPLLGEDAVLAIRDAEEARANAGNQNMEVDEPDQNMEVDNAPVKMIVMDGICVGPLHCAFGDCTSDVSNARGGVFCDFHNNSYGAKCRIRDCENQKIRGTEACGDHQNQWRKHRQDHSRQALAGVRRILQHPRERMPWQETLGTNEQAHDEEAEEIQQSHYFSPNRFYCIETICAPCGVVIAWAKFAKAESPTNILHFLERVYPTEISRPDYICIDKACAVLRTSIVNKSWETWKNTSRFIVDSYHYINHRTSDYLCRKWCNPAPLNGSAPNLVIVAHDKAGQPYRKRAFNTQACEQLNAWLGGFESIIKRMTTGNFNWYLHTMLFYHTMLVVKKQMRKEHRDDDTDGGNNSDDDDDDDDDSDTENDHA